MNRKQEFIRDRLKEPLDARRAFWDFVFWAVFNLPEENYKLHQEIKRLKKKVKS